MTEGQTAVPPSLARLLLLAAGGLVVASVVTVTMVLPAEFGRDPTGMGRVLGLTGLAQTEAAVADQPGAGVSARFHESAYRTDVVDIPLFPKGGAGPNRLEYKVRMRDGGTLIYSWRVQGGDASGVYYDLHSETDGPDIKVVEFKQGTAGASDGSLVAPIDGVHGWYWENRSDKVIVIQLKTAGFYDLIPPGEVGNKAGIVPAAAGENVE